ncbi:MAG TPA: HAD family phosphatase [Solirubrobacteraceae bacterium]|nr:HAD family phosphatase [Solirubrobacteraceae bacterium]
MIQALLFDFDGLLYDSETSAFEVWRELYAAHGVEFPRELWQQQVMGRPPGASGFDPLEHLEELAAPGLDPAEIEADRHRRRDELFPHALIDGARELLAEARARGIRTAIVSSNHRARIHEHLARAGEEADFDAIVTADGDADRGKPNPALYLEALAVLGVPADRAVAFEDSPNGVRSAKAAGLRVVAVPNWLTEGAAGLEEADEILDSLAEYALFEPAEAGDPEPAGS